MTTEPEGSAARRLAALLFVLLAAVGYAATVVALSPDRQAGIDSHYHYLMARQIASGELLPDMAAALPLTLYAELPVDHYWGFHALIAPFGAIEDQEMGMKVATIFMFGLVLVALYGFLRTRRVPYAWVWAALPALFTTLDWRYLMLRGGQLMVPLMLLTVALGLYEARRRRRLGALFVIGWVGMLSYHGAVVLLPLHVVGLVALRVVRPDTLQRGQLWEPLVLALGLAAGLTLNPYMTADAATWRFAAHHIGTMGTDAHGLYPTLAEFHGFPAAMLLHYPEWLLLLALVLVGAVHVLWRWRRDRTPPAPDLVVAGALALAGVALAAAALRATEYAVPLGVAFVALWARDVLARRGVAAARTPLRSAALAVVVVAGLALHAPVTLDALRLPAVKATSKYEGAYPVLAAHGGRPVLNIAEADYNLLAWEYPEVQCVQGLSRYFLWPYREVYRDVQELHDRADTSRGALAALDRFWRRGVRLVAAHRQTPVTRLAARHPDVLVVRYLSPTDGSLIFELDRVRLSAALAATAGGPARR